MTELEFQALAAQGFNRIPLITECLADLDTPLSVYCKLNVQAAAGIVYDSEPELEWQETEMKARAVLKAADCLEVTAQTSDGEIMGVKHRELAVEGVQFHPESIDSEQGLQLLENFLCSV